MSFSQIILLLLILKMISSCAPESTSAQVSCPPLEPERDPLVIGQNDWILASETGDEKQNTNELTVGLITVPKLMAKCTGFLVSPDVLMTNNHCIPDGKKSELVTAIFRLPGGGRKKYECTEFIMTSVLLDFTLVRCQGKPGLDLGWVGLATQPPLVRQDLYLVQENCDYIRDPRCEINKYVSYGSISKIQSKRLYHNADTLGGSSGSPIFSKSSHQVIGIHNSGYYGQDGEGDMNLGIPMYQIRNFIESTGSIALSEFGSEQSEVTEEASSQQECTSLR